MNLLILFSNCDLGSKQKAKTHRLSVTGVHMSQNGTKLNNGLCNLIKQGLEHAKQLQN